MILTISTKIMINRDDTPYLFDVAKQVAGG